jgi:N-acetylmuramoyl-L-alanine amidase
MYHRALIGLLWLLCFVVMPSLSFGAARLKSLDWSEFGQKARLTLEFSARPTYRITRWTEPRRLVVDLADTGLAARLNQPPARHPAAARILTAPGVSRHGLRLLVDLKTPVEPTAYLAYANGRPRLVLEWHGLKPAPSTQAETAGTVRPERTLARSGPAPAPSRDFVVAVDAGHGGKDAGAIGPRGTREKDVVLAIARQLAGFIRAEPDLRAVLVRSGDRFVGLRERVAIARRARADLFVSLHADAHPDDAPRGFTVFVVSEDGASSEAARWLADRENAPLLRGLKARYGHSPRKLVRLATGASRAASEQAAAKVLRALKKNFPAHHHSVQQAGFVVLKSLDMPSLLVETAFISNPAEERRLRDRRYQTRIARAIFNGIRAYAAGERPVLPIRVAWAE